MASRCNYMSYNGPIFTLRLEDLRFFSRIGVFEQERNVGNEFRVDCSFKISADSFTCEDLSTTVSYADVYCIIENAMKKEWKLLESVAVQVAYECRKNWPGIIQINVKITKLSPPISGLQGSCSVEYTG